MPTLNWIGKEVVVKHHKDVPFRLLELVPELSLSSPLAGEGQGERGQTPATTSCRVATCTRSKPCCRATPGR